MLESSFTAYTAWWIVQCKCVIVVGFATSKWIHPWLDTKISLQVEGTGAPGAVNACNTSLSGTSSFVRQAECSPRHLHHLPVCDCQNIEFCHNIHMEQARNALLDTYFYHLSVSSRKCGNRYRHGWPSAFQWYKIAPSYYRLDWAVFYVPANTV